MDPKVEEPALSTTPMPIEAAPTNARALPPGTVSRPRLLEAPNGAGGEGVIAVIAPPGYGKTTILLELAQNHVGPTLWVDLDAGDNDAVVLISKLVASLGRVGAVDSGLRKAVRAPGPSVWDRLMPRLGVALSRLSGWLAVFDDLHEVTSTQALDVVTWLALHLPEGSRLALAGRSAVGLPLARLRLDGRLREVGPSELAFTDDEAGELLSTAGSPLGAEPSTELNRRCEGWAAGLRMAALARSLRDTTVDGSIPDRRHHFVTEYVLSELLPRLTGSDADFMVQASVLHRLHPDLCDAVLERTDSGRILRELAERSAFITLMDDDWYRCHDLIREALIAELAAQDGSRPRRLRRRAAEWHAAHGQPEEAVRYEQESGDRMAVLAMIGRHSRTMFGQGRTSTVVEWLEWVESERLMTSDPNVALSGMIALAINGEGERAGRWADALASIARDAPLDAGDPSPVALASLGRSLSPTHGPAAAVVDALEASRLIPVSSPWKRVATTSLGLALLMDEQEEAAEAALAEATAAPDGVPAAPNAEAIALGLRAMLMQRRGDLAATRSLLEEADSIRERADINEQGPQALQDALVAVLAIADGDPSRAMERLTHAQTLRPLLTWAIPGLAVVTRCQMAQVYLELADVAGARTLLLEVNDVRHRRPALGSFGRQAEELRSRLGAARGLVGASTLTSAELRLVPMLATHLSFKEIGDRLYISGNTVKTHAMSIYRKLEATSRSEAVANAVGAGILDPAAVALVLQAIHRGPTHP